MAASIGSSQRAGKFPVPMAALAVALASLLCACGAEEPARGPGILIVTIDSLRADHLGYAGLDRAATPNIDALAARSLRFADAQSPSPLTLPALAALHTGRYPSTTGVRSQDRDALPDAETTLAEAMAGAGYRTGAVAGSILLHPKFGLDQGFADYLESFAQIPRPRSAPVVGVLASRVVDKALEWLEGAHRERFFLWVNFHDPHYFYSPPPPFDADFADHPYDGEIAYVDRELGRLIDRLETWGVDDSTIIVLAGNHGEGLMDHGEAYHGTLLYQSTLQVPLLIKPAGVGGGAGSDIAAPVSLVDLAPTLLDLAGVEAHAGIDGRSLAAAIRQGPAGAPDPDRPLLAETILPREAFGWRPIAAARSGRWKYIASTTGRLFDLEADPGETTDVSAAHPDIASRLASLIEDRVDFGERDCGACPDLVRSIGFPWPAEAGAEGREIDPESRIDVANDVLKAHRSMQRRMVEAAELIYRDVLKRDPENRLALIDLAFITGMRQDLDAARRMFATAQRLYAGDAEIYHMLGHLALVAPADQQRATTLFRIASALDPLNEEALYDAACGVALEGDKEKALDLLEGAIAAGFRDFHHMRRDTDLDAIRGEPRFADLVPSADRPGEGASPYEGAGADRQGTPPRP